MAKSFKLVAIAVMACNVVPVSAAFSQHDPVKVNLGTDVARQSGPCYLEMGSPTQANATTGSEDLVVICGVDRLSLGPVASFQVAYHERSNRYLVTTKGGGRTRLLLVTPGGNGSATSARELAAPIAGASSATVDRSVGFDGSGREKVTRVWRMGHP